MLYEARLHSEETQATGLAAATIAIGALLFDRDLDSALLVLAFIGLLWTFALASLTRLAGWGIRRLFSRWWPRATEHAENEPESDHEPAPQGDHEPAPESDHVRNHRRLPKWWPLASGPFEHLAHEPKSDDERIGAALQRLREVEPNRAEDMRVLARAYWQEQAVAAWDLAEFKHLLLKIALFGLMLTVILLGGELIF